MQSTVHAIEVYALQPKRTSNFPKQYIDLHFIVKIVSEWNVLDWISQFVDNMNQTYGRIVINVFFTSWRI